MYFKEIYQIQFISSYTSPIGEMLITADKEGLTRLWFKVKKLYSEKELSTYKNEDIAVIKDTKNWLDIYFSGKEPNFTPSINMIGTSFRIEVWKILKKIPYGKTTIYGKIANEIAKTKGSGKMSAQAVGGAVVHNNISIIIPCHRVIGANGNLTGFDSGIDKKIELLKLEGVDMSDLLIPKKISL